MDNWVDYWFIVMVCVILELEFMVLDLSDEYGGKEEFGWELVCCFCDILVCGMLLYLKELLFLGVLLLVSVVFGEFE